MTIKDSCTLPDDHFWIWIDDILYNLGEDPGDYDVSDPYRSDPLADQE